MADPGKPLNNPPPSRTTNNGHSHPYRPKLGQEVAATNMAALGLQEDQLSFRFLLGAIVLCYFYKCLDASTHELDGKTPNSYFGQRQSKYHA